MHGTMKGYYEIRITGPGRMQHRLFCILDNADKKGLAERGFDEPHMAGRQRSRSSSNAEVQGGAARVSLS